MLERVRAKWPAQVDVLLPVDIFAMKQCLSLETARGSILTADSISQWRVRYMKSCGGRLHKTNSGPRRWI